MSALLATSVKNFDIPGIWEKVERAVTPTQNPVEDLQAYEKIYQELDGLLKEEGCDLQMVSVAKVIVNLKMMQIAGCATPNSPNRVLDAIQKRTSVGSSNINPSYLEKINAIIALPSIQAPSSSEAQLKETLPVDSELEEWTVISDAPSDSEAWIVI